MTSSKHLYTVKIRMFEKTDSVTLDQLETFRTPPELQEKAAKQLRSQIKNSSWFYNPSVNWQFLPLFWTVKYTEVNVNPWYQHCSCILTRVWCVLSFKTINLVKLDLQLFYLNGPEPKRAYDVITIWSVNYTMGHIHLGCLCFLTVIALGSTMQSFKNVW